MDTAPADLAARIVDEQFLQLICDDPELLAAEFDAIIAAEWPAPPTDEGGPKATCRAARGAGQDSGRMARRRSGNPAAAPGSRWMGPPAFTPRPGTRIQRSKGR